MGAEGPRYTVEFNEKEYAWCVLEGFRVVSVYPYGAYGDCGREKAWAAAARLNEIREQERITKTIREVG